MTTSDPLGLLDSNSLIYADQELSPFHIQAKALRDKGLKGEIPVCVCPQVLSEFFAGLRESLSSILVMIS